MIPRGLSVALSPLVEARGALGDGGLLSKLTARRPAAEAEGAAPAAAPLLLDAGEAAICACPCTTTVPGEEQPELTRRPGDTSPPNLLLPLSCAGEDGSGITGGGLSSTSMSMTSVAMGDGVDRSNTSSEGTGEGAAGGENAAADEGEYKGLSAAATAGVWLTILNLGRVCHDPGAELRAAGAPPRAVSPNPTVA